MSHEKKKRIFIKKNGKNLTILNEKKKYIRLRLKDVFLKFGIEDYNKNKILNIYVNRENDSYSNEDFNTIADVYNYVKSVAKLAKDPKYCAAYGLDGKGFSYPLKKKNENGVKIVNVRTYLARNVEISLKGRTGSLGTDFDISGYLADIDIVIKTLWKTNNNFGVIIYTENIELNKKIKKKEVTEESDSE